MTLYTVKDVCKLLSVGAETVYRWIHSGELKGLYLGRGFKVREQDLEEFLEKKVNAK